MTREAPSMVGLREHVVDKYGRVNFLGIVGDSNHYNGYHLGPQDLPPDDYSLIQPRDSSGALLGNYASAIDVATGWADSRAWFTWLVNHLDDFPDLVEVVGSRDGETDEYWYWRPWTGWVRSFPWNGSHLTHYHLGFFRDSVFRTQTNIFTNWYNQSVLKPPTSITTLGPKPIPVVQVDAEDPTIETEAPSKLPLLLTTIVVSALAWVIKRRMEATREDSQQDPR